MYLRKTFFLALFVLSLLLCGQWLLLQAIGFGAKAYFYWARDSTLDYGSLIWEEEGIVFTDIVLKSREEFSVKVPEVVISVAKRHIQIISPKIELMQFPTWEETSPISWTLSLQDGSLIFMHGEEIAFAGDYDLLSGMGSASLSRDSEIMTLHFTSGAVDVECEQLELGLLHPSWLGKVQGSMHLIRKDAGWLVRTGFLEMDQLGFGNWIEGVCGTIHWDGALRWDGKAIDWTSMLNEGRCRVFVSQSETLMRKSDVMLHGLEGSLSFDGKAGAKWQFVCASGAQKLEGSGKGFFHSLKECWIESELRFGETLAMVRGSEQAENFVWEVDVENLTKETFAWVQEGALRLHIWDIPWQMEKGVINASCQCVMGPSPEWNIRKFFVDHVRIRLGGSLFSCDTFSIENGAYHFEGAQWDQEGRLIGNCWEGAGKIYRNNPTLPEANSSSCFGIDRLQTFSGTMSGQAFGSVVTCNLEGHGPFVRADLHVEGSLQGDMFVNCEWQEEGLHFAASDGNFSFLSSMGVERLRCQGRVNSTGLSCFDVHGAFSSSHWKERLPFYCPVLQTDGIFDIRLTQPVLDLARWTGKICQGHLVLDANKSHILGERLGPASCDISSQGFENARVEWSIAWNVISRFYPLPIEATSLACSLSYSLNTGTQIAVTSELFSLQIQSQESLWISSFDCKEGRVVATWEIGREGARCLSGQGTWGEELWIEFTGNFLSFHDWDLDLSTLRVNPHKYLPFSGWVEGKGIVSCKGTIDSDFDVTVPCLQYGDWAFGNDGTLHISCSQIKGLFIRGGHFFASNPAFVSGQVDGNFSLLQYDFTKKEVLVNELQLYLPIGWHHLLAIEDVSLKDCTLQAFGDLSLAADFSKGACTLRELTLGLGDTTERIQNGHLSMEGGLWKVEFELEHQKQLVPLEFIFHAAPSIFPIEGRCIVDRGLIVDWVYDKGLSLQAIEGECRGIRASFCLEGDSLIGSAHLNGHELKTLVPAKIGKVFQELKIGSGYELMGRVAWEEKGLVFKGIISGKEVELFGFQLRNLLGKIAWDRDSLQIEDFRVSDLAGTLQIDTLTAGGEKEDPWKIFIPEIRVRELRPSLLRTPGESLGKLTPLVLRELKMYDFQGFVDDRSTYTAHGDLFFINSYKRGKSILELPSDLFSRILGLDLDLLVPVCGALQFKVHDGFFHLTDLEKAYSENQRSEFFLVYNEDSPKMDLDWNLHILIQMKQFVLFKFTEAFIISVTGKLDDPKFHLQRKNSGPSK